MANATLDRYSVQVFYSEADGCFVAICPDFPGVSAFGDSQAEAMREFRTALELAIETYEEEGWPLPTPSRLPETELPSGEFRVRLPRSMHAQLARRAALEGVSQNYVVVAFVAAGLAGGPWQQDANAEQQ
ncbi:MAG: type II toxin-antitoxin system HicB family antitoxin [Trueperaceae bacterium]|jgi:predicted RNase H-like HicB family nuclease